MNNGHITPSGNIVAIQNRVPVMPAVTRILSRYDRANLEAFISVAIDLLDVIDDDPDLEDSEASNPDVDERGRLLPDVYVPASQDEDREHAWIEWHTMRGSQKRGPNILAGHEDDEDDDASEDDDPAGQCDEDEISAIVPLSDGPGCPISDVDERSAQPVTLNCNGNGAG